MNCACGFRFSGPDEFRNCEAFKKDSQWYIVCPTCKKVYESD